MNRVVFAVSLSLVVATSLTKPKFALADGNLQHVNHIIVIMQENHSFDN
jgi:phospholipase C